MLKRKYIVYILIVCWKGMTWKDMSPRIGQWSVLNTILDSIRKNKTDTFIDFYDIPNIFDNDGSVIAVVWWQQHKNGTEVREETAGKTCRVHRRR